MIFLSTGLSGRLLLGQWGGRNNVQGKSMEAEAQATHFQKISLRPESSGCEKMVIAHTEQLAVLLGNLLNHRSINVCK